MRSAANNKKTQYVKLIKVSLFVVIMAFFGNNTRSMYSYFDKDLSFIDAAIAEKSAAQESSASEKKATLKVPIPSPGESLRAVDCLNLHYADELDQFRNLTENPKSFVELLEPNFWIALDTNQGHVENTGLFYEEGITAQFQDILKNADRKGIVVDVGMNIGWYTVLSRSLGHQVFAFDANPIMHKRVCSSLKFNQWWDGTSNSNSSSSGVTTFVYGVGDRVGQLRFLVGDNSGLNTFLHSRVKKKSAKSSIDAIDVPVTTLDTLASEQGWLHTMVNTTKTAAAASVAAAPIIHLLKIDVEGYEPFVIKGASKLLKSGMVRNILHELSAPNRGDNAVVYGQQVTELFDDLIRARYGVHMVTNAGGIFTSKLKTVVRDLHEHVRNRTLTGSVVHQVLGYNTTKVHLNMWWKPVDDLDLDGPPKDLEHIVRKPKLSKTEKALYTKHRKAKEARKRQKQKKTNQISNS